MDDATPDWQPAIEAVLDGRAPLHLVFQPVVDLQRGTVVGHEALARFPAPPAAGPDRWFAAADRLGYGPALSCAVLAQAVPLLERLPADTFLSVNLEPEHLLDRDVAALFDGAGRLDRLVVELTEHAAIRDLDAVLAALARLQAHGARTAIDDAGSGYAGLQALLHLRPDLIKLDRSLVSDLDRDPAKRILLRALGEIADGIDAWVLGEGIERQGELEELVALGVPLGQGYLLGRPTSAFVTEVPIGLAEAIIARIAATRSRTRLVSLLEPPSFRDDNRLWFDTAELEIDRLRRPVALHGPGGRRASLLLAKPTDAVREVAMRVVARADGAWSDPVVVTDGRGTAVGIVTVPRLLEALAGRDVADPVGDPTR